MALKWLLHDLFNKLRVCVVSWIFVSVLVIYKNNKLIGIKIVLNSFLDFV